jgi:hypothetical protein
MYTQFFIMSGGEGVLGGFMCRFGTMEHILEGMKTLLHITA